VEFFNELINSRKAATSNTRNVVNGEWHGSETGCTENATDNLIHNEKYIFKKGERRIC
jgi:hypothetical protein